MKESQSTVSSICLTNESYKKWSLQSSQHKLWSNPENTVAKQLRTIDIKYGSYVMAEVINLAR